MPLDATAIIQLATLGMQVMLFATQGLLVSKSGLAAIGSVDDPFHRGLLRIIDIALIADSVFHFSF